MHRKFLLVLVPTLCLLLASTSLYLGHDHLARLPSLPFSFRNRPTSSNTTAAEPGQLGNSQVEEALTSLFATPSTSDISSTLTFTTVFSASSTPTSTTPSTTSHAHATAILNGTILAAGAISPYVKAIFDPTATIPRRLECPTLNTSRYDVLRQEKHNVNGAQHIDFFFALDLRNCLSLLPRLLGSVVEAAQFLGPQRCALSIVEGNSPDGTADVLVALRPLFDGLGLSYHYRSSDVNPAAGDRIHRLAELRNLALQPMFDSDRVSGNTTVLFINDVAACVDDILELALQRRVLGADMTCAMDWTHAGPSPTFYDVWISRTIRGDSFFEIGPNGSWDAAWNLFWNDAETGARYRRNLPFQVFSCWNGAAAISAAPFLDGIRFRSPRGGDNSECMQGEPQLLCKDMWFKGYGKIAVVPTVNLEYSNEKGAAIKQLKGYTSDWTRGKAGSEGGIDWALEPPKEVKCMPSWNNQFWRPWNESLHA